MHTLIVHILIYMYTCNCENQILPQNNLYINIYITIEITAMEKIQAFEFPGKFT